jgi:O-antigen ligase
MVQNPVIGTGFESFWLGPRLEELWSIYWWRPTQAHNGYLEVYLNLGCAGLLLLARLMFTIYRKALRILSHDLATGQFGLVFFVVTVVYNFTEASVKPTHPIWMMLILGFLALSHGSGTKASHTEECYSAECRSVMNTTNHVPL